MSLGLCIRDVRNTLRLGFAFLLRHVLCKKRESLSRNSGSSCIRDIDKASYEHLPSHPACETHRIEWLFHPDNYVLEISYIRLVHMSAGCTYRVACARRSNVRVCLSSNNWLEHYSPDECIAVLGHRPFLPACGPCRNDLCHPEHRNCEILNSTRDVRSDDFEH